LAGEGERAELFQYLKERFGIPGTSFDGFLLFRAGKSWWLLRNSAHLGTASRLKIHSYGLKAFETVGRFVKPTTRFVQLFGPLASKSLVRLTDREFHSLLAGEGIQAAEPMENGYVLLMLDGRTIVGLGLLIRGTIRLQVRKSDLPPLP
jgi:NOL1/NOP2/fmu family ribosome biogenesis protein